MSASLLAARNLAKATMLLAACCTGIAALGWAAGGIRLASLCAVVGLLAGLTIHLAGDRIILGMVGAREIPVGEAPMLHATVEALARRALVLKPRVYLIRDGHPRAFSTGRGASAASIAVSQGLLLACPPDELEAVLAHEIAHIRTRDVVTQTAAVVVASFLYDVARLGGFLERPLRFVLGPLSAAFVHVLLSPRRELDADRLAAGWCDTPHSLADALLRLEHASELVGFDASPVTSPLWSIDPFPRSGPSTLFATHPPVGARVAALRALDPDWHDESRAV